MALKCGYCKDPAKYWMKWKTIGRPKVSPVCEFHKQEKNTPDNFGVYPTFIEFKELAPEEMHEQLNCTCPHPAGSVMAYHGTQCPVYQALMDTTPEIRDYLNNLMDYWHDEERVNKARKELQIYNLERMEDFINFLRNRHAIRAQNEGH